MKKIILIILIALAAYFFFTKDSKENLETKNQELTQEKMESEKAMDSKDMIAFDKLNLISSNVSWYGGNELNSHVGDIQLKDFSFTGENGLESGFALIDMTSIKGDAGDALDNHLKNEDFFDVEKYPESRFEFTQNEAGGYDAFLTIKDQTHPVKFTPEISEENAEVMLNSEVTFDRTKFGVNYKSESLFAGVKDKLIPDEVKITTTFTFAKKA